MYDVLDVSRYVINYSNQENYGVSNLKLQKLLYFIQAYFLIVKNSSCFKEDIEAWDFGPVVPVAYYEYRFFGSSNIPNVAPYTPLDENKDSISQNDLHLIEEVVNKFRDYSASDLVKITHMQSPWITAHNAGRNTIISTDSIRSYFND